MRASLDYGHDDLCRITCEEKESKKRLFEITIGDKCERDNGSGG